ncbi:MAG: hypothetical protein D4R97_02710 [Bacteroidetes bacterium]|nr:MAG: hypothetical protein D4R97_02710 [Bacteroidota bacterium]
MIILPNYDTNVKGKYILCEMQVLLIKLMQPNAPQAAAVRVLADFIFEFRFHFSSHDQFIFPPCPALRLHARWR